MVYQPIVSNDKLLTGTQVHTQAALGKILSLVVGQSLSSHYKHNIGGRGGSYLKYLKPIDVEHAHDFVASFRLSLRGDNLVRIWKIANPVMYRQCESRRIYGIS